MTDPGTALLLRPRLLTLLADSPARMVLLKAPPGFGKTALLQSYAAQCREALVWVNCQQADNDPMCLANNLGRALLQQRLITPQALERQFNGFGIPSPELINDSLLTLLQQAGPLTLVFNDAVFNMRDIGGVKGWVLRNVTQSIGGPRVSRIMKLFVVKDRAKFRAHLLRLADTPGLRRMIVSHDRMETDDAAGALRTAASTV